MTNPRAIYAAGEFLRSYLQRAYEREKARPNGFLQDVNSCSFVLLSSGEFLDAANFSLPRISLYLYRVTVNEHLRNLPRANHTRQEVPLPLDLHYLLTAWADKSKDEHVLMGWAARELYLHPVLDSTVLDRSVDWESGDQIRVVAASLTNEEVVRVWEILQTPYHLSMPYVARLVRIDPDHIPDARPVVVTRFSYSEGGPEL
jgi:hypothetical protein